MMTNVPAVFVDGVIRPDAPLDVPNGSALEIDIRMRQREEDSDRSQLVREMAEVLKRASFRSGKAKFNREDLYDRP